MNKPYYIIRKEGRNIQVRFAHMPKKVFSTGTRNLDKAIKFAEEHVGKTREEIKGKLPSTLNDFAEDIFSQEDPRGIRSFAEAKNRLLSEELYERFTSHLKNYVLPRFGKQELRSISEDAVASWLQSLTSPRTGRILTYRSRRDIRKSFYLVMQAAERLKLIEDNPIRHIEVTED